MFSGSLFSIKSSKIQKYEKLASLIEKISLKILLFAPPPVVRFPFSSRLRR